MLVCHVTLELTSSRVRFHRMLSSSPEICQVVRLGISENSLAVSTSVVRLGTSVSSLFAGPVAV